MAASAAMMLTYPASTNTTFRERGFCRHLDCSCCQSVEESRLPLSVNNDNYKSKDSITFGTKIGCIRLHVRGQVGLWASLHAAAEASTDFHTNTEDATY